MASYGSPLTAGFPSYLVTPHMFPPKDIDSFQIKVLDFREANFDGEKDPTHCHLVFQASEIVLAVKGGLPADVWSLNCTVGTIPKSFALRFY